MTVVVDCGAHTFKASTTGAEKPELVKALPDFRASLTNAGFWESLGASGNGHFVVALPWSTPRSVREELCEFLFEKLSASFVSLSSSTFLAALGAGLSTTLVVDIGEGGARVVPVEDGYPLPHCGVSGRIGGATLSLAMLRWLKTSVSLPPSLTSASTGEHVKETVAWVGQKKDQENLLVSAQPKGCTLVGPCGGEYPISCGDGFKCGELLFDVRGSFAEETAANLSCDTLPELILASLRLQSNINLRGKLLENILVAGGTAQLPGLQERLVAEIRCRSPWVAPGQSSDMIKVCEVKQPDLLAWRGGSLLTECDVLKDLSISRAMYQSIGPAAVHEVFM